MLIYFSGHGFEDLAPENVVGKRACVMFTFANFRGKSEPEPRFEWMREYRRLQRKKNKKSKKKKGKRRAN